MRSWSIWRSGAACLAVLFASANPHPTGAAASPQPVAERPKVQQSVAHLSQARSDATGTVAAGQALIAGGWMNDGARPWQSLWPSDVVDLYDIAGDRWSAATLSRPRARLAAASAGGKALFAGGLAPSTPGDEPLLVDIYDTRTGRWSATRLPHWRLSPTALAVGKTVLFVGGESNDGPATVDVYDVESGRWSSFNRSLSVPCCTGGSARMLDGVAMAAVGSKVLISGGSAVYYTYFSSGQYVSDTVDVYDTATAQLSTVTLSAKRAWMAAASVGTKAMFAGGSGPYGTSAVVDIYDSATNQWSTANLSEPRGESTAEVVGRQVFFAGGRAAGNHLSATVDIFDAGTGAWSTARLSEARTGIVAAVVGTFVIFAGGDAGDRRPSAAVDVLDTRSGKWTSHALPQPRTYRSAAVVGDTALFTNAADGAVDAFDARSGRWSTLAQPRGATAVRSGALVLVAGKTVDTTDGTSADGSTSVTASGTAYLYDGAAGTWSTVALPRARKDYATVAVGDVVFFAGGRPNPFVPSDAVDIYDAQTGAWSTARLSQPRYGLGATAVGDLVFFAGGYDERGTPSAAIDVYNAVTGQWSSAALREPLHAPDAPTQGSGAPLLSTTAGSRALFARTAVPPGGSTPAVVLDVYDAADGTWSAATVDLPNAVRFFDGDVPSFVRAAASLGDLALLAGTRGRDDGSIVLALYDGTTGAWSIAEEPWCQTPVDYPYPRCRWRGGWAAGGAGPLALFAGGWRTPVGRDARTGNIPWQEVGVLDTANGAWSTLELSQARWGLAAVGDGTTALFAGGITNDRGGFPARQAPTSTVDVFRWCPTACDVAAQPRAAVVPDEREKE